MEIVNIIKETENPLFERKEIELDVQAEVTPSHSETLDLLSKKFSTKPDTIRIKKIHGSFGSKTFLITANIYNTKEDRDSTEHFSKKELESMNKPKEPKYEENAADAGIDKKEVNDKPDSKQVGDNNPNQSSESLSEQNKPEEKEKPVEQTKPEENKSEETKEGKG